MLKNQLERIELLKTFEEPTASQQKEMDNEDFFREVIDALLKYFSDRGIMDSYIHT